jgi:hypothetical protein
VPRGRRSVALLALFLLPVVGCGGGSEPRAAAALDEDAFAGDAEAVTGGTVELGPFAERDLVVWFWSPW